MPHQTPSQTVGPFFSYALTSGRSCPSSLFRNNLVDDDTPGLPIRIVGRVLDGDGDAVPDAMIEIWQADHRGRFPQGPSRFRGFGRAGTDANGRFSFRTIKPGPTAFGAAPNLNVVVFARGMLNHAFTRIYFSDEEKANRADGVLSCIPIARRPSLIAAKLRNAEEAAYDFTIRLQGDGETVFFDA